MNAQYDLTHEHPPIICLVDDDAFIRALFTRVIQRAGCDVIQASNAIDTERVLAENRIHMVLSDLMMPDAGDGEALLLKIVEEHPNIPVCMMSGAWNTGTELQLRKMGAAACILKPFTAEAFNCLSQELIKDIHA